MKKQVLVAVTAFALTGLIAVGGTLAFYTGEASVMNQISMGKVEITLTEPQFAEKTKGTYKLSDVTPGQVIAKDPTITNVGNHDVYVRCKVNITNLTGEQKTVLLGSSIDGADWVYSDDGYYYYQQILPKDTADHKNVVTLFSSLKIPSGWDSEMAEKSFDVSISAEAIQADNFTPVTDTNGKINGWKYSAGGNVPITASNASVESVS